MATEVTKLQMGRLGAYEDLLPVTTRNLRGSVIMGDSSTAKEYRKRGSASGRAVYDDPRVAVGPLVLAESERERRRRQNKRHSTRRRVSVGASAGVRSGTQYAGEADAGRARAAAGHHVSPIFCS